MHYIISTIIKSLTNNSNIFINYCIQFQRSSVWHTVQYCIQLYNTCDGSWIILHCFSSAVLKQTYLIYLNCEHGGHLASLIVWKLHLLHIIPISVSQNCRCNWSYPSYHLLLSTLGNYLSVCSHSYWAINNTSFTDINPFGSLLLYDY